jgi:hypothetical protein
MGPSPSWLAASPIVGLLFSLDFVMDRLGNDFAPADNKGISSFPDLLIT